jgi:hypothetical protein
MVDELLGWGLRPSVLVADAGHGDTGQFRHALADRGIDYAVSVAHTLTAYPLTVERTTAPYSGDGRYQKKIYRQPAVPGSAVTAGRRTGRGPSADLARQQPPTSWPAHPDELEVRSALPDLPNPLPAIAYNVQGADHDKAPTSPSVRRRLR